ncbi:MAG: CHAP domain-containing protein [Mobilitalea sp.]
MLQPYLNNPGAHEFHPARMRLNRLLKEFNIDFTSVEEEQKQEDSEPLIIFERSKLANIAEELAAKNIIGEKNDYQFMDIIKYYPEPSAFDELKNYWCAAFVYHCALLAGLELPIKQPPMYNRFAGVGSWYEWGKANGFCYFEKEGFIPARGDIVIYNNIIPPDNKPKDSAWHDHTGILISCEKDYFVVAEGNIDNQNVSGIINRNRDAAIGCFIRIPDNYIYDGWKYDYKEYYMDYMKHHSKKQEDFV